MLQLDSFDNFLWRPVVHQATDLDAGVQWRLLPAFMQAAAAAEPGFMSDCFPARNLARHRVVWYNESKKKDAFDMVNFKWDQKRALEVAKEDGISIGTHNAMMDVALNLLKQGIPMKVITDSTKLSLNEVRKIAKDNGLAF